MKAKVFLMLLLILLLQNVYFVKAQETTEKLNPFNLEVIHADDTVFVDKILLESFLKYSDTHLIFPLKTMGGRVSAYLIQYYDSNGVPISYAITSNEMNPEDHYYIEFGNGDFIRNIGFDLLLNEHKEKKVTLLYIPSFGYFIYDGVNIVTVSNGGIYKLSYEEQKKIEETTGDNVYYEEYNSLDFSEVLAKEVGYTTLQQYNVGNSSDFKTMAETASGYYQVTGASITNHCAPTAALNTLYLLKTLGYSYIGLNSSSWKITFRTLHYQMGTTNSNGTYDVNVAQGYRTVLNNYGYRFPTIQTLYSVSWNTVVSYQTSGCIHMMLHGSEIYNDHSVLYTGNISFTHSSGWVSRYYKIVDGWTTDNRYVHSSLGIDHINMVLVNPGSHQN